MVDILIKMAIISLLFISDTFVNEAHPLNKEKCHFSLSFLCSVKFTKQESIVQFELFSEHWLFLKTRQIQMWIVVNMIMEIDFRLVNKKHVS